MSDMFSKDFNDAFAFTVGIEAGYVNDPADPGGETNFGISKRAYPNLDIKKLTLEDAKGIYWKDYWLKTGCNNLPFPMNIVIFDNAVNAGVPTALANLKEWGGPTPKVIDRRAYNLLLERLEDFCDTVDKRPASLKFLKGWVRRVIAIGRRI